MRVSGAASIGSASPTSSITSRIEGEFGLGKPDPRVFEHVLERLAVSPADAWMIGGNLEAYIAGAQAVGILAILYDPTSTGVPDSIRAVPDRIIGELHELLG